jgi:hypothetical protein
MIGNTCQDIGKPGTRIDIVEARGGNQRIHRRRSFAAAITAGEQPALPAVLSAITPGDCWSAAVMATIPDIEGVKRGALPELPIDSGPGAA